VQHVGTLGEEGLRAAADHHHRAPAECLQDHLARRIDDTLLGGWHRRRDGRGHHFTAAEREGIGEAFGQRRGAFIDRLHGGRRLVEPLRDGVDERIVDEPPP
jgi:hypothetical protein